VTLLSAPPLGNPPKMTHRYLRDATLEVLRDPKQLERYRFDHWVYTVSIQASGGWIKNRTMTKALASLLREGIVQIGYVKIINFRTEVMPDGREVVHKKEEEGPRVVALATPSRLTIHKDDNYDE
jgi:hypothetical protein